jgi:hypothetical protein
MVLLFAAKGFKEEIVSEPAACFAGWISTATNVL